MGKNKDKLLESGGFADLVNSIPHSVFCKDLEGRFIYANPAFCTLRGVSLEELVGKTDYDLHTPEEAEKFRADDLKVMETGESYSSQERNDLKDGSALWGEVVKSPIRDDDGNITGVMGMFWDITKQKTSEQDLLDSNQSLEVMVQRRTQELMEANRRLEEHNKLKDAFISSVSHELRTPLTSILGFAKIITRDASKLAAVCDGHHGAHEKKLVRVHGNAEIINKEANRLKRLIDDLLDFSKMNSGKMTWEDKVIDLNNVAVDSVKIMQGLFVTKPAVTLLCTLSQDPALVLADRDRLQQVFINLLNNAAKFTAEGHVKLELKVHGAWVEASVTDTGLGIAPEDEAVIFDDYRQAAHPLSEKGGTGLGLSISKQIIDHYEGKLWVESTPGKGSSFRFRVPRCSMNDEG